jgi:1-acyl-sn-glycerol-3-phosphate acyltransferase
MHIVYYLSLLVLRTIDLCYCRSKVIGADNIPAKGGCILACNHISNLDPFIIGTTTWRFLNFMAKEELFRNKFMSWYWHQVGAFPIKRGDADFRAIREAIRRLKMGRLLVMFPEGTRGSTDRVKKINPGIGLLVKSADVPVIPVNIKGTDGALPNGAKWLKCHQVTIILGRPLSFDKGRSNLQIAESIMDKIRDAGLAHKSVAT